MRSFPAPTTEPSAGRAAAVRGGALRIGRPRRAAVPAGRRLVAVLTTLFALLFMQLAVASHACADIRQAAGPDAAMAAQACGASMTDCEPSSEAAPTALCHAHCQEAKASLDSVQLPAVEAVSVLPSILPVPPAAEPLLAAGPAPSAGFFLQRTTAPPLSIRHCCLRL